METDIKLNLTFFVATKNQTSEARYEREATKNWPPG